MMASSEGKIRAMQEEYEARLKEEKTLSDSIREALMEREDEISRLTARIRYADEALENLREESEETLIRMRKEAREALERTSSDLRNEHEHNLHTCAAEYQQEIKELKNKLDTVQKDHAEHLLKLQRDLLTLQAREMAQPHMDEAIRSATSEVKFTDIHRNVQIYLYVHT